MVTIIKLSNKAEVKKKLESVLKAKSKGGLNAKKYLGVIKLKEDPMLIQKRLRDEWE